MRSRVGLRSASLLALGALAVHEGRFALAYGSRSGHVLAAEGHAYLNWIVPLLIGCVVTAAARFLARLARPVPGAAPVPGRRRRLWATASALLLAVYAGQEWSEGLLVAGHPSGLLEPFAQGGWVVVLLAPAVGAVIAGLLWGADVVLARAAAAAARPVPRRRPTRPRPPRAADPVRRPAIALHLAGRAPPAAPA
jgi:hypothetical protein